MILAFSLDIKPMPKGRPRLCTRGGKPRIYTPPATERYETTVATRAALAMDGTEAFTGPLSVQLEFRLPPMARFRGYELAEALAGHVPPVSPKSGDVDNYAKAVLDALNGIVWVDDCQIVRLSASKRYAEVPGFSVIVENA